MARLIELKQTAPERFLARFDTGEEVRTTLAVVTDFHLRSGKELTSPELDALRAASERSRCRQRALRIIGARAMSVKELTDRLKEKGESPENAEDAADLPEPAVLAQEVMGELEGALAELQAIEPRITAAVYEVLTPEASAASRKSYGGTSPEQVRAQIARWKEILQ